jgi:hypothetical protein
VSAMPASVDPPIRVAHALLGRTSQRLAPMHAETVKLANFLRRLLQSAVRLAHHIRTHHPEALDVNAMQATPRLGTRVAGGFSEVVRVRRAVLGSTRRRLGLLHAQNVRLASLPTVRLLSSARTVVRMRIPMLGARGASA